MSRIWVMMMNRMMIKMMNKMMVKMMIPMSSAMIVKMRIVVGLKMSKRIKKMCSDFISIEMCVIRLVNSIPTFSIHMISASSVSMSLFLQM